MGVPVGPKQGYYHDRELDLYLLGMGGNPAGQSRETDPATGRHLSKDPLNDGNGNDYLYVRNNPVNAIDPSGLQEAALSSGDPAVDRLLNMSPAELKVLFPDPERRRKLILGLEAMREEIRQAQQQGQAEGDGEDQAAAEPQGPAPLTREERESREDEFIALYSEVVDEPQYKSDFPATYPDLVRNYFREIVSTFSDAELQERITNLTARRALLRALEEHRRKEVRLGFDKFVARKEFADAQEIDITKLTSLDQQSELDSTQEANHIIWPQRFTRVEMEKLTSGRIAIVPTVASTSTCRVIHEPLAKGSIWRVYELVTGHLALEEYAFKGAVFDASSADDALAKLNKDSIESGKEKALALAYLIPGVAAVDQLRRGNPWQALGYAVSDMFLLGGFVARAAKATRSAYGIAGASVVYDLGIGIAAGFAASNSITQERYWEGAGHAGKSALLVLLALLRARGLVKTWKPKKPPDIRRSADLPYNPSGTLGAARAWTKSARLRAYQRDYLLPTKKGKIRYIPPDSWSPNQALPRGTRNGFIDKFGNEWVQGPSRTPGELWEWDVQLGPNATPGFKAFASGGTHVNVSQAGEVTHVVP